MKKFFKVMMWIIILGAIFFGIYAVLPEYPKNFVKSFVQPIVDSNAKMRIDQIKNLQVTDIEGVTGQTYQSVLEKVQECPAGYMKKERQNLVLNMLFIVETVQV